MKLKQITNNQLRKHNIPVSYNNWREIQEFALAYNAYEYLGDKYSKVTRTLIKALRKDPKIYKQWDLDALRTMLFYEQRK